MLEIPDWGCKYPFAHFQGGASAPLAHAWRRPWKVVSAPQAESTAPSPEAEQEPNFLEEIGEIWTVGEVI